MTDTQNAQPAKRTCILVLGMHRSGTSAVTRVLSLMGAALPKNILGAGEGNEAGHWEPARLIALHDQMLAEAGSRWDDWRRLDLETQLQPLRLDHYKSEIRRLITEEYGDSPLFVLKEPRICRFVPLYREVLAEMGVAVRPVLAFRHPLEVAASLAARNKIAPEQSRLYWLRHVLDAERASRGLPRCLAPYDALLRDWRGTIAPFESGLGLNWPHKIDDVAAEIDSFLIPGLRHHAADETTAANAPAITEWVRRTHAALNRLHDDAIGAMAELDDTGRAFDAGADLFGVAFTIEHAQNCQLMDQLNVRTNVAEQQIAELSDELSTLRAASMETNAALASVQAERDTALADIDGLRTEIEEAQTAYDEATSEIETLRGVLEQTEKARQMEIAEAERLRKEISQTTETLTVQITAARQREMALLTSTSWRLTAPLRILASSRMAIRQVTKLIRQKNDKLHRGMSKIRSLSKSNGFFYTFKTLKSYLLYLITNYKRYANKEYQIWIESKETDLIKFDISKPQHNILISIILPTYNTKISHLIECIESVIHQTYQNWELCIADDASTDAEIVGLLKKYALQDHRIKLVVSPVNGHISKASNLALNLATGEWVALLDHDDTLAQNALQLVAQFITKNPDTEFIYSDKDMISDDGVRRFNPLLKPGWSPEMMYSVNYLTHFNVMRTKMVRQVGGFRSETDGAQDWDLFLRITEKAKTVSHIPGILYHWRVHEKSTSTGIDAKPYAVMAQQKSLNDHFRRMGLNASISEHQGTGYRVNWHDRLTCFTVIVTPGKNSFNSATCIAMLIRNNIPEMKIVFCASAQHVNAVKDILTSWKLESYCDCFEPIIQDDVSTLVRSLAAIAEKQDASLTFISGDIACIIKDSLADLPLWVQNHPKIGFASGIIVDQLDKVVQCGYCFDKNGHPISLFEGEYLYNYGIFGGAMWHRNISSCNGLLVSVSSKLIAGMSAQHGNEMTLDSMIFKCCADANNLGMRGVIVPGTRAVISPDYDNFERPPAQESMKNKFFHSYLMSGTPLKLAA